MLCGCGLFCCVCVLFYLDVQIFMVPVRVVTAYI